MKGYTFGNVDVLVVNDSVHFMALQILLNCALVLHLLNKSNSTGDLVMVVPSYGSYAVSTHVPENQLVWLTWAIKDVF